MTVDRSRCSRHHALHRQKRINALVFRLAKAIVLTQKIITLRATIHTKKYAATTTPDEVDRLTKIDKRLHKLHTTAIEQLRCNAQNPTLVYLAEAIDERVIQMTPQTLEELLDLVEGPSMPHIVADKTLVHQYFPRV